MKTLTKGFIKKTKSSSIIMILAWMSLIVGGCSHEEFEEFSEEKVTSDIALKALGDCTEIALKGNNNRYVSSENGQESMNCNRTSVNAWESFTLVDVGGGQYAIRGNNGRYVSSENGQNPIICNRTQIGAWERFTFVDVGGGEYAIRGNNGRYISSENGTKPMICNRTTVNAWERFEIEELCGGNSGGNNGDSAEDIIGGRNNWKLNGFSGSLSVGSDDNGLDYRDDASLNDSHFFFENNGYAVFRCYPGNPTSGGSSNPRSETREQIGGGDGYWDGTTNTERSMKWRFSVEDLPPSGKLCFGQIHERDDDFDDIIRVQVEGDEGQNSGDVKLRILGYVTEEIEGSGRTIDFDMSMDTEYYFELTMRNSVVRLYELNNNGNRVRELFESEDVGDADENYFKAGCYLQSTKSSHHDSNVYGQVSIRDLSVSPND